MLTEIAVYLAMVVLLLTATAVLVPPVLYVLYSNSLWGYPPFSWLDRWWEYWMERSL